MRSALLCILGLLAGCEKQEATRPEKPASPTPESTAPKLPVEPVVIERGVESLADEGAMVVVTATSIMVDGKEVVPVAGGEVDPSEKQGGAHGMSIPKLTQLMKARAAASKDASAPVRLLADPATSARLLFAVITSSRDGGARSFRLVVARPDKTLGALPIELPDTASSGLPVAIDAAKKKAPPPEAPAGIIVSVTRDKLLLWSMSGLEGTLDAPKLAVDAEGGRYDLARLTAALVEIAQRRWADAGRRPPDTRSIILQVDGSLRYQLLAELIAAVRTRPDGQPLFPDVLLGLGFD